MNYTQEEIDNEVETRVRFKMNELLTGVSNRSKIEWQKAFHSMNPKHQHYSEAFNQVCNMFEKELFMAYPYKFNEKQEADRRQKINNSIEKITRRLKTKFTRESHEIERFLYHELENLIL